MNAKSGYGTGKVLKIAACVFYICIALAGYAAQFGDFTYEEHDSTIEITDYPDDATGVVIIPSEIVGNPVTIIGEDAFRTCYGLTSGTIPDSVIKTGNSAFRYCSSLTSVYFAGTPPTLVCRCSKNPTM